MRIISGKYRGRHITPPAGFTARPTTDFARESLFNILSGRIDFHDISVLDLFAGTGSIGFEFASRGCENIDLVEINFRHFSFIRKVIKELELSGVMAIHTNVKTYLKSGIKKYDIVFADPPYSISWLSEIPDLVIKSGVMLNDGILILEHPKNISFKSHQCFSEHRKYGNVNFTFFNSMNQII